MQLFIDNFSKQADKYQKFRPSYPSELFEYLSSLTSEHRLAWDCGTGNGQSAISLTNYYDTVFATDPSKKQIENASTHKNIIYKVECAEHTSLKDKSVDLITVAQAVHWFDFNKFYAEVKRVLKTNGIISVWTYGLPVINPQVDKIVRHYHDEIVGEFWQAENKLIDKEYTTIPFPFDIIATPQFSIHKKLLLTDVFGLLGTWSATQKFIDKYQKDPLKLIEPELCKQWDDSDLTKTATWKLILKVGRNVSR